MNGYDISTVEKVEISLEDQLLFLGWRKLNDIKLNK